MLSRFRQVSLILFVLVLMAQSQPPAPPAKTSIAVYPIKAVGAVDKSLAATFSSLLNHELTQSPKLIVIKESMLEEVMKRQAMNISDACDDTVCQVEIGKLVQAQKMVTGELSKMGSNFFLTLDVVDVRSGANEWSGKEKCSCTEDQLELLVAAAGAKIRNYFGENLPIPALPQAPAGGQAFVPAQPSATPQGAQAFLPAQPPKTFQEFHPEGAKGGPMVLVSDFKFYIDKFEVTNQDYQECVAAGVCKEAKKKSGFDAPQQPVVFVNQDDGRTYCQWAGKRLPKEQEWQEAAQGTDGRQYPWGNQEPNCSLANYFGCGSGTDLVGSKPAGASPYGALDMAGNAWEWVEEKGVVRGGGWYYYA
jgi:formylglycine-generating enzyme required for sulfatase activity